MKRRGTGSIVALLVTGALATSPALRAAADEPARDPAPSTAVSSAALEHYTAGRESYHAGLFGRALEEFERSLALAPSPNTRLYLARTLRELGRWPESAEQYRVTIREAEERIGRYAATRDAADLELRDVRVRIEKSPARDDTSVASQPAIAAPRTGSGGPSPITWASGGVAIAGAASFALFYGLSGSRYGYLEDHCMTLRDAACDSARTTGKTEEVVAYVSLAVAAAAAAMLVVSLVVRPSPSSAATASAAARRMGTWRLAF